MATTRPIRSTRDIKRMKEYFLERGQIRNHCLITLALNTSLRISDLLRLTWGDVYSPEKEDFRQHLILTEQKTGKRTQIRLNQEALEALTLLWKTRSERALGAPLFPSRSGRGRSISRSRAYVIVRDAARELGLCGVIGCHSLRKTFGYQAWKKGVSPALIMAIYNHSSYEITKRYLSIEQEEKDEVFLDMNL